MEQESKILKVYKDLYYSHQKLKKLKDEIKEDFKFAQGKQWEERDVAVLRQAGVKALTINKIKPTIRLITGIERQSKGDFKAYPEGGEDAITAEIVTRLVKNVAKNSRLATKQSEMFKSGIIGGMSFLEPYIDYSYDLINGDLKWKRLKYSDVFFDPDFQEYDMSDAKYFGKLTFGLTRDELISLFPDKEKDIKKLNNGKLDLSKLVIDDRVTDSTPGDEYAQAKVGYDVNDKSETRLPTYDLIDYYSKEWIEKYYAFNTEQGILEQFDTKEEAERYAEKINGSIFSRKVPVVMLTQICGTLLLYHGQSWTYPHWKNFPIIPFFADLMTEDVDESEYKIQGIVRGIKDLNEEFNKRRTQQLRHLNASANSGFDIEKGQLDDQELRRLKKFGSSPGFVVQRKRGTPPITRITPMPLSQGHSQLAAENAQDLKEASGVNPDLLANDSQSQSGRAILLKQRQGLVMVQEILDNFADTKVLIGKFILSQLSELFTVESAIRVLGEAYIADNFSVPVNMILERGLAKVQNGQETELTELEQSILLQYPDVNPEEPIHDNGELIKVVDTDMVNIVITKVLNDSKLNKYDIAVGEGVYNDTIRMANFNDLKELAQQGVPIPPQSLIELSMIPEAEKKKILQELAQQMQAQLSANTNVTGE